ncbi:hypothetical protein POSPLADRAFT_1055871 [Postia placenta MAD-698-R-SB12]|uniref:Uncharacterized protein n=1 Tax=Postia placenta MAD-698-R-SB12 TaxID=670580 RepID=A0A1X6N598_9APHY|nr:hypothetical protein POSPLADRAFT_1055871 [Postia placenta MAD-698-R-SB12]OSX63788.1 hypothetical protein POSPLADRAFT_1055871 [Postia placenta MAD-698-R-SB12]
MSWRAGMTASQISTLQPRSAGLWRRRYRYLVDVEPMSASYIPALVPIAIDNLTVWIGRPPGDEYETGTAVWPGTDAGEAVDRSFIGSPQPAGDAARRVGSASGGGESPPTRCDCI